MVDSEEKCSLCNGNMTLKETKEIAGTLYKILKCEKCNHQIARHKS